MACDALQPSRTAKSERPNEYASLIMHELDLYIKRKTKEYKTDSNHFFRNTPTWLVAWNASSRSNHLDPGEMPMWSGLRISLGKDPDFAAETTEILQSIMRSLIIVTMCTFVLWYVWYTVVDLTWPKTRIFAKPILLVGMLACAPALWLAARRHVLAAQVLWQVGMLLAITLALAMFRQDEIAFLYALLPLLAVTTTGWPAGLITEILVIIVLRYLPGLLAIPPLHSSYISYIAVAGVFTGVLGWAATRTLLVVSQQALAYSEQALNSLSQARERKVELEEVREDLLQANRELARLSDRLQAMYRVAEEARQAKEEFVANVSHELRTPLNMIISFSEMITQSPEIYGDHLPSALLADVSAIQRNSRHLSELVDDVLDLSQVEAGRMALSKEWVCLAEIIQDATISVRALFEQRKLYLQTQIEPDLPQIFCDGTRIKEVLINLLSNAGRFTEQGGVWVKAWRQEQNVVVSVQDTGPGIAPADQERIFEPFQQLDSSIRRRHGGTGLGLGISKRLVEMHRGKMWLQSQVGQGTAVFFSLPSSSSAQITHATNDPARWLDAGWIYHMRTRPFRAPSADMTIRFVLLEKGDTLKRLLNRYMDGIDVCAVSDLDEALRELNRSPAQALIVNTASPIDVIDPTGRLTNLPYGTPAITCWVPGQDEAAEQLSVARYLLKPVKRETILSTLRSLEGSVRSVLIADDSPEVLQLFTRMLASAEQPYEVLQAANGQQALDILRERQPDAMILDLMMPEMDGYHVLELKRQDPAIRSIPVIVISARDPAGGVFVGNSLSVARGGGLSILEILDCLMALTEILAPSSRPPNRRRSVGQGLGETPDVRAASG